MLVFVLYFLVGILWVQQMTELPEPVLMVAVICVIAVTVWLRCWKALFLLLGIGWTVVFESLRINDRLPELLAGQNI